MRPFAFCLRFIVFPLLLEVTAPNVHTVNRTAVEISRMTDLIRMQFLALHARMMKDKHQRMKERGFYKVSVAKRTVIRQCKA